MIWFPPGAPQDTSTSAVPLSRWAFSNLSATELFPLSSLISLLLLTYPTKAVLPVPIEAPNISKFRGKPSSHSGLTAKDHQAPICNSADPRGVRNPAGVRGPGRLTCSVVVEPPHSLRRGSLWTWDDERDHEHHEETDKQGKEKRHRAAPRQAGLPRLALQVLAFRWVSQVFLWFSVLILQGMDFSF